MKDKDRSSQKKSTGPGGAPGTKRPGSGGGTRRSETTIGARFQAVFEGSRDAIGISKAGIHVFVNPAYLELFGFPPGTNLAGKPVLDFIAPECRDQIRAYILRRVRGESAPSTYETRGLRTDGSAFDMEVNVSSYRESGEDHSLVILRDVTERKRAEEEIAERGAMMQQIMDTASVAIFLVDRSGRIVHANRRMAEMFGCSMGELVGSEYVDHVHPSERETGRQKMLALLASKIPSVDLERLYWRKDNSEFWGHLAGRRFHDVHGNELGLIGVITDITERKRAEETLRNSEERLSTILDNVGAYIFIKDTRYRYTYMNRKACELVGRSAEDILGKSDKDFFSAESVEEIMRSDRPVIERGETVTREETELTSSDKVPRTYWTVKLPLRDGMGTVTGLCGISTDITARKRAEQEIREKEGKYRVLFEAANDGIFIQDATGFIDCNHKGAEMYGLPKEKIIGRSPAEFAPERQPDGRLSAEVAGEKIQAALNGVPQVFEWQPMRADGSTFDVEITLSRLELGGAVCLQAIVRDITERKRTQEALRENEMQLSSIFNNTSDRLVLMTVEDDNRLRVIRANTTYSKAIEKAEHAANRRIPFMGRYRDEVLRDVGIPEEAREYEAKQVRKAIDTRSIVQYETSAVIPVGRVYLDVSWAPIVDKEGRCGLILYSSHDITERKRTEEALRENKERLDLALQSAHMGVWRWEIKENRRYFDDLTCQLLGIDAATFDGTEEEFFRAVHPKDRDKIKAVLARTIEQDVLYETTYRVVWRDGSVHDITARGRLARDDEGQPTRINGILWDITDQRLLEDERLKTQKLESIGTLAGGIAHDFNNLLQGIFGFISMAKLTFDQKEKSLAMLTQAEKALHQSVNLTSQLLTFSKGGKPLKKVIALRPLIENAVAFALSGSRITYEIIIDENLRAIEADEGQISQVIQNIVLNADQAMPLGGMIRVSVRNMPAAAIVPHVDLQGDLVEISIRDQGTGIPPEHLTRIFDPYFTTKEKGSGLGLATAYSIIKNHGGLLRVKSKVGKGTTFFIYLPASGAAIEEPKRPTIPAAVRKGRVLVMDDEEVIRAVAGELLTALGHDVAFAQTGEAALETYRAARDEGRPFDVVILDLTIRGGMGGIEALRKLVEIDPDVKAVVSSGYSDDAALSNYRKQGFRSVLKKPYNLEDLQRTLNSLLA